MTDLELAGLKIGDCIQLYTSDEKIYTVAEIKNDGFIRVREGRDLIPVDSIWRKIPSIKVGDKVYFRTDLVLDICFGGILYSESMSRIRER